MLTEWKLSNFKSFKELDNFNLGPVTVLAGPNSSGKTVLLQSILLIAQTLGSPVTTRPLILNAEPVKMGTWDDIPHSDLQDETVTFECRIDLPKEYYQGREGAGYFSRPLPAFRRRMLESIHSVRLLVLFDKQRRKTNLAFAPVIGKVAIGVERADLSRRRAIEPSKSFAMVRRRKKARSAKDTNELMPMLPTTVGSDCLNYLVSESIPEISDFVEEFEFIEGPPGAAAIIGVTFRHFLPDRIVRKYDATTRLLRENIMNLVGTQTFGGSRGRAASDLATLMQRNMFAGSNKVPQDLIDYFNSFFRALHIDQQFKGSTTREFTRFFATLPSEFRRYGRAIPLPAEALPYILYSRLEGLIAEEARQTAIEFRPFSRTTRTGEEILEDFFANKIKYLGPLRDDPRVIYALPPTPDVPDVGIKGQYTAVVLDRNKDRQTEFIDPSTGSKRNTSLQEAVITWLKHMDMLQSVSTREEGKLGYKLTVRVSGLERELDLTTVGVGVSQVLPILVMALLASPNDLLIFEQPEIHLHPKVQSLLGDFFLSIGQLGKQCLIETHSEYLVNRLRFRIAEADGDEILKLVKMYFVERKDNTSSLREVQTNEYGAILEWPAGFFDEGALQAESIIRSSSQKRKNISKTVGNENPH